MARSIALTPKDDKQGAKVKLKVFWKTTKFWTAADVTDFQKSVHGIAERLRTEQYWNKDGDIRSNKFTCEDFAVRLLCEYAKPKGLPVKLTTGVRTFRNMEIYNASEHDSYASNIYGFSEMVMLSYGAPDMQRLGVNTTAVATPEELQPGDILARANDTEGKLLAARKGSKTNVAHHIQVVVATNTASIAIYQGNSDSSIHWPLSWINKIVLRNPADPKDDAYGGMKIERALYTKNKDHWDYKNFDTGAKISGLLKEFMFYRWSFYEFNK